MDQVDYAMCLFSEIPCPHEWPTENKHYPTKRTATRRSFSPFIFILCTEALVSLLNHAENKGKIIGIRVAYANTLVSHLLFADDRLFLCKAKPCESDEVIKVVRTYGNASRQCISFEKLWLIFEKRVPAAIKQQIKDTIGIEKSRRNGILS